MKLRRQVYPSGKLFTAIAICLLIIFSTVQAGSKKALKGHAGYIKYLPAQQRYILKGVGRVDAVEAERNLSTAICGKCHEQAVAQLKNSIHYSTQGANPRILFPGGGAHGMLDRACGLPGTTGLINFTSDINLGECSKCHVGRFLPPMEGAFTSNFMQMGMPAELASSNAQQIIDGGLNCLICHAEHYLSVRDDLTPEQLQTLHIANYAEPGEPSPSPQGYANLSRDNTDFDHDGQPDPLIDTDGDGEADMPLGMMDSEGIFQPWPTVAQDRSAEAVLSVGKTDEHTCLRCHEHARTGYKRGTLFRVGYDAHANLCFPNPNLTADDPNCPEHNACTACHVTLNEDLDGDGLLDVHKFVRGHLVGGDLAAADYPPPPAGEPADPDDPTHLTCIQCHETSGPEALSGMVHSPKHLDKIACETCHITKSGGITYSMYGHGGHVSFGRNAEGRDTKVITADHMISDEHDPNDVVADFEAFRLTPVLMWFNGSTSFLAQSLAFRDAPNAKITPFKPMANGMLMDGRFFNGDMLQNSANIPYNAHSMYRFFANATDQCNDPSDPNSTPPLCSEDGLYGNAEVFTALQLLGTVEDRMGNLITQGMTPVEVRKASLMDLLDMQRPDKQTMAMMQAFPNLMNFSKAAYQYEHYLISSRLAGSTEDADENGIIDVGAPFLFDMLNAVNVGLDQFKGFNMPMFLPASYDWYPKFELASNGATMQLPDGSFMKLFLGMQLQQQGLPMEKIQQLIGSYPAFSNGVTLGGHGITPDPADNALGGKGRKQGCLECHGAGGVLESPVPVTEKQLVDLPFALPTEPPQNKAEMPVWRWRYYNVKELINLGLTTSNEDLVSGAANVDIGDDPRYVRNSDAKMILNWFAPTMPPSIEGNALDGYSGFSPGDAQQSLAGSGLSSAELSWSAGDWMPVLEPLTHSAPNYAVLGYLRDEVIWEPHDKRLMVKAKGKRNR